MKSLILGMLISFNVIAGPLEEFVIEYKEGTALNYNKDYQELYNTTTNRDISFVVVKESEDVINALYTLSFDRAGTTTIHNGVVQFYLEDGKIVDEQHVRVHSNPIDMARAGQAADVVSTAAMLGAGFVEGNTLIGGAIGNPVGAIAVAGLKIALVDITDAQSKTLAECIANRKAVGGIGWGAGGWNLGLMAAGLPGAMLGAVIGAVSTAQSVQDSAAYACIGV